MKENTYLGDNQYPLLPCEQHQERRRRARRLPCNLIKGINSVQRPRRAKTRQGKKNTHLANNIKNGVDELGYAHRNSRPFAQLLPAPLWPKTKLSGRKRPPRGPDCTESIVPGSRSIKTARGTYLLAAAPISL
jgi:hypothetical protein